MLSSLIGNLVGKSFAKVLASFNSANSFPQNTSSSQKPNSEFAKEKVSKLQALENKISSAYCEGSDFVKGFSEGINPLTPLTDFARNVFKSPPEHCGNGTSFNSGKMTGAKTGLLVDTFLAADGTVKASGGVACSALSSGGCAPVATPAIAVGASEVVAGAAMGVGHASNYMLASQKKESVNHSAANTSNIPQNKSPQKLEETPHTNRELFENVRGTNGKRHKETGEIWVKDKLHKDHYEVYKYKKDFESKKQIRNRAVWEDGRLKEKFK